MDIRLDLVDGCPRAGHRRDHGAGRVVQRRKVGGGGAAVLLDGEGLHEFGRTVPRVLGALQPLQSVEHGDRVGLLVRDRVGERCHRRVDRVVRVGRVVSLRSQSDQIADVRVRWVVDQVVVVLGLQRDRSHGVRLEPGQRLAVLQPRARRNIGEQAVDVTRTGDQPEGAFLDVFDDLGDRLALLVEVVAGLAQQRGQPLRADDLLQALREALQVSVQGLHLLVQLVGLVDVDHRREEAGVAVVIRLVGLFHRRQVQAKPGRGGSDAERSVFLVVAVNLVVLRIERAVGAPVDHDVVVCARRHGRTAGPPEDLVDEWAAQPLAGDGGARCARKLPYRGVHDRVMRDDVQIRGVDTEIAYAGIRAVRVIPARRWEQVSAGQDHRPGLEVLVGLAVLAQGDRRGRSIRRPDHPHDTPRQQQNDHHHHMAHWQRGPPTHSRPRDPLPADHLATQSMTCGGWPESTLTGAVIPLALQSSSGSATHTTVDGISILIS